MSKIKEVIVATILPAIKEVGKVEIKHVLAGIKEHNQMDVYKNTLFGLHANFSLLREVAVKSKTKIDDGIIDLLLEAVQESADADNIIFP